MDRTSPKEWYCYLLNKAGEYYSSAYNNVGQVVVSVDSVSIPLNDNPANLKDMQLSFGTNKNYFSGVRAVAMNFIFVGDGADIIRNIKYLGKGYADEIYLLIERWNPYTMIHEKYYHGRLDLAQTKDTVTGYSVPIVDNSAWGVLSQNDDVKYAVNCNPQDLKTIPIIFDGITLRAKYTYQPVAIEFHVNKISGTTQPFATAMVNTDGDSSGVITGNQTFTFQNDEIPVGTIPDIDNNYIIKTARQITVRITGSFAFQWKTDGGSETGVMELGVVSNLNLDFFKLGNTYSASINGNYGAFHTIKFDRTILMSEGQSFTIVVKQIDGDNFDDWHFKPSVINFDITTNTQSDAVAIYGKRPLDVIREIVGRATNNQYVVESVYFSANQNLSLTCGDALRKSANAMLKTSFRDWFKSYDVEKWLAFRVEGKVIWVEPATDIYNPANNLFELGEVKDVEVEDAYEYLCNEIELNMNKQDYRHPSGRLEFNGLNSFSIQQLNVKSKLSLISPYRKDCYGMQFIIMDYQQQSTEDNSGDDTVFMVDVTNTKIAVQTVVYNFANLTVNNAPLAPIIYFPYNNDVIHNDKPIVRGVCQPSTSFNIYVDGIFDGTGTSDINGIFAYNIQTSLAKLDEFNDGVHTIELTFSDLTGTTSARTVTIMDDPVPPAFENLHNGDYYYNNTPFVRGFLKAGQTESLVINGIPQANITGDGNGRWGGQFATLPNGVNTISLGATSISFTVNSFVETPLITSFEDGFQIQNNLPLIRGVAKAGTVVTIYLDYFEATPLGTATANSSGYWSFQVVPINKPDGTTLAPISNGLHIISTSIFIDAAPVTIVGYKLNRPAYQSIEGVLDSTVFNTELTPKKNLLSRMPYWKSIFYQQPATVIKFETADKNGAFGTTIGGVTTKENTDVKLADYPDSSLFYPYIFHCTVIPPFFFAEMVESASAGGLVKFLYQGLEITCLPIGKMSVEDISLNTQKWSMLVSTQTPLTTLMNLSNPGSIFTIMANSIYRSDYNTLHFVRYDRELEAAELHEDWFANRNERWLNQPQYVQKLQLSEVLIDQVIVKFDTPQDIYFTVFDSCGVFVTRFLYSDVTPSPIVAPEILKQVTVDLNSLGEGDFFFMMMAENAAFAISELVSIKEKHYGTILIDGGSSKNTTGTVFSNGWRSKIRVEGLVEKWIGNIDTLINEDESGSFDNLKSIATKRRTVLFGNGQGLPDWLYIKICNTILLDDLAIQGVKYVISKDARVEPVEKIAGYPMYYYSVDFTLKDNATGYNFTDFKVFPPLPEVLVYEAFWAWSDTPFTTANLPAFVFQKQKNFNLSDNILADYTEAPTGSYLAMKYPANQPLVLNWFNTSFNYGTIPDQVFFDIFTDANFNYVYSRIKPVLLSTNKKIIYS